jgi:ABC-type sugar transport system ATPase subunit
MVLTNGPGRLRQLSSSSPPGSGGREHPAGAVLVAYSAGVAQVRLEAITKTFGDVVAVDDVTLTVADHDFMILLGPSGCGKSTLLRTIAGLEDPTAGDVYIGDARVNDVEPKARDVAMVFQSYALYPHKTVQANIEFPLKARGVDRAERARQAIEAADVLGLRDQLGRRPGQLSGGQRQRVALARAIVRHPAVFCMDEPLSNLDAKLRSDTRTELVSLHRRLSSTFIYVTHDQVEAMTMGTHVAVMNRGRIEQIGVPAEVYARPASVFVAQFIGTPPMNVFPAGVVEPGDRLVGVRPEHVRLDPTAPLRVAVELVELLGHETLVHGRLGETAVVARLGGDVTPPLVGEHAGIDLPLEHRHRFDAATGLRVVEGAT